MAPYWSNAMRTVGLKHYALKAGLNLQIKVMRDALATPRLRRNSCERLRGAPQLCRYLSQPRRNTASMRAMFAQMQGAALKFAR